MSRSYMAMLGVAAAVAAAPMTAAPTPAAASQWGCEVLLCLASPESPTQYAECVPPITRLWRHLAAGGSFPSCDFVDAGAVDVRRGVERYLPCEDGFVFDRDDGRDGTGVAQCRSTTQSQVGRDHVGYESYRAQRRADPNWIELVIGGVSYGRHYF